MKQIKKFLLACLIFTTSIASPAWAFDFEFDHHGSLGEGKFKRYVPPLSQPYLNESPYITTELRMVYIRNQIPGDFVTKGGDISIYAAEIRVALTERLGFIATKDGYTDIHFDSVLPDTDGFENISFGFKYAVFARPETEDIVTVGIEYEPPTGSLSTAGINLQGGGDGFLDYFLTAAHAHNKWGFQGNIGYEQALDSDFNSSILHWHGHVDYELLKNFFPLIEVNGLNALDDGNRTQIADFEGNDAVNFGSTSSKLVVTGNFGARYKFSNHVQVGLGYEVPLTKKKDLIDWRTTMDLVLHF
jgi:hypothetical protein